jgi:arsenite methyltransferase
VASSKAIPTHDDSPLARKLGAARFFSITYRLFKLREGRLESSQEDYGHIATYKGTIEGAEAVYSLDASHRFEKAR